MLHPAARAAFFVVLTVVFSACLTMLSAEIDESARPEGTQSSQPPQPTASEEMPTASPATAATQPTSTTEPTSVAGPPFPAREPGVVLIDEADLFSAATEELAARRIADIASRNGADVVVYTQFKPGSDDASTENDAIALKLRWRVTDGLVIMWNTTRTGCLAGAADNGHVQLYADSRFSVKRLSDLKRQQIYEELMLPLLLNCKQDEALLAALDGIAADIRTPNAGSSTPPTSTKGACGDPAYKLSGFRWDVPYEWFFQEASVPDEYSTDDVLDVLTRSVANITNARNDCGLPDKVSATAEYVGPTTEPPCVSDLADGYNSVGFGELRPDEDEDTIAFVCTYGSDDHVVEADMLINSEISWALSEGECEGDQELLEATVTHEFGHVFGLTHVSERLHGDLTMSPTSNGPCETEEISLGLGDILGLEELY
jgi:hypothetical protein